MLLVRSRCVVGRDLRVLVRCATPLLVDSQCVNVDCASVMHKRLGSALRRSPFPQAHPRQVRCLRGTPSASSPSLKAAQAHP